MEPCSQVILNGRLYCFAITDEARLTCESFSFKRNYEVSSGHDDVVAAHQGSTSCQLNVAATSLAEAHVTLYSRSLVSPLYFIATPCVLVQLKREEDQPRTLYVLATVDPMVNELKIVAELQEDSSFDVHALLDDFNIAFASRRAEEMKYKLWRFEDRKNVVCQDEHDFATTQAFQLTMNDPRCLSALQKINAASDVRKEFRKAVELCRGTDDNTDMGSIFVQFHDYSVGEYCVMRDEFKWICGSAKHTCLLVGGLLGVNLMQCLVLCSTGAHSLYDGATRRRVSLPDAWSQSLQCNATALRGVQTRKRALDVNTLAVSPLLTKRIRLPPSSCDSDQNEVGADRSTCSSLKLAAVSKNLKMIIDRGKTKLLKASKKVQNKELFAKVIAETSSKWTTNHSLRSECLTKYLTCLTEQCFPKSFKPISRSFCYCPSSPFKVELQTLSRDDSAARFIAKAHLSYTVFRGELHSITVTATSIIPVHIEYVLLWSTSDTGEENIGTLALRGCALLDKNEYSHLNFWQRGIKVWIHWMESDELCSQQLYCVNNRRLAGSDHITACGWDGIFPGFCDTIVLRDNCETLPSALTRTKLLRSDASGTVFQFKSANVHEFHSQLQSFQPCLAKVPVSKCSILSLSSATLLKKYIRALKVFLLHLSKAVEEARSFEWWTEYINLQLELLRISLEISTMRLI